MVANYIFEIFNNDINYLKAYLGNNFKLILYDAAYRGKISMLINIASSHERQKIPNDKQTNFLLLVLIF